MLSSSNLITLATLWMSGVSNVDADRGAWGSSHGSTMAMMRHRRRGSSYHAMEDPVAELVRDFLYLPPYPNSLMRPQGPFRNQRNEESFPPQFDVSEGEDGSMHLTMEVPGLAARDLNVELKNNHVLRVSGVRTRRKNGYVSQSEFDQSIRLKDTVDVDRMEANLSSGVLTITVPLKPTKVKKLPVSTDDRSILDPPSTKDENDTVEVHTYQTKTEPDS